MQLRGRHVELWKKQQIPDRNLKIFMCIVKLHAAAIMTRDSKGRKNRKLDRCITKWSAAK